MLPSEGQPLLTDPACLAADSTDRKQLLLPAPLSLDMLLSLLLMAVALVTGPAATTPQLLLSCGSSMNEDRLLLSHSDMALSRRAEQRGPGGGSDKEDARREEGRER